MHIVTKSPFDSPGTRVALSVGERDLRRGAFRHAGLVNDKIGYKISGQYLAGTDWAYDDPAEPDSVVKGIYTLEGRVARGGRVANRRDHDVDNAKIDARIDLRPGGDFSAAVLGGFARANSINLTQAGAVFFDSASLAAYLEGFMPTEAAAGLAAGIAAIPLGTVTPLEAGALNPADIVLTFRNFVGDVSLYGLDLSAGTNSYRTWR